MVAKGSVPLLLAFFGLSLQGCAAALGKPQAQNFHDQLTEFFASSSGLAMSYKDAVALADKEISSLQKCSIDVPALKALKDALYLPSSLNLPLPELRQRLFPVAYQQTSPKVLTSFYQTLSHSTFGFSTADAQNTAMGLAMKHAEPDLLFPLYNALTSSSLDGPRLTQTRGRQMAVDLTAAGADAPSLLASYADHAKYQPKDVALQAAIKEAVASHLYGITQRYAKDVKAYTPKGFQEYYGDKWLVEWQTAPQQKRTANDGKDYLASEFKEYFGSKWNTYWASSPIADQVRIATDGNLYTMAEFQKHYGNEWQAKWFSAYEVLRHTSSSEMVV